jgi:hypothetical protein
MAKAPKKVSTPAKGGDPVDPAIAAVTDCCNDCCRCCEELCAELKALTDRVKALEDNA